MELIKIDDNKKIENMIYEIRGKQVMLDIFETSKESIIIIDNYADKKLLDLVSKTNRNVIIYSKNINKEWVDEIVLKILN